jgi:acyl carrier protein
MNQAQALLKITSIINETFDTAYDIVESTSAEQIDEWDSISHIELITNIEKAFGVRFALGELQDLKNVGEMAQLVVEKLK